MFSYHPEQICHLLAYYKMFYPKNKIVVSSGFYNPLHRNHLKYLNATKKLGDYHIAVVNGDKAQVRKSGYSFLDEMTRLDVVQNLKCVDLVMLWQEDTVDGALELLRPDIFAKGGDRASIDSLNDKEVNVCSKNKIEIVFGVGGYNKDISSSNILKKYLDETSKKD